MLLIIAIRNLLQHTRRTLFLGGALTFTTFLLVMLLGLTHGIRTTILETSSVLMTGHINVGGFYKITAGQAAPVVVNADQIAALMKKEIPEISYITERGRGWARVVSETGSGQFGVGGIDIATEPRFREVVKVIDGKLEGLEEDGTILLFKDQADKLGVKAGDTVTLSAPTLRGANNTVDLRVAAVAQNLGLMSSFNTFVPNRTLRSLYQLNETASGVVHLYLEDIDQVPAVQARVRKALEGAGYTLLDPDPQAFFFKFEKVNRQDWTGQRLDITSWEEEVSFLDWVLKLMTSLTWVLVVLLLVVIGVGIMNTLWIAIRERTREIGTLRAIGMQRGVVTRMFLLESIILALAGTLAGAALGLVTCAALNAAQIGVPLAVQMFVMRDTLIFNVDPSGLGTGMAVIIGATTLASLIPSFRAARLQPVTAIHHVG
jgi:ABC-type lipoprotein release transport system permease subunit